MSGRCIEGIPVEQRPFSEGKTARVEARMVTAARAGDLDIGGALAARFASWLDELFGDQT